MSRRYDLICVGGGTAGLVAAIIGAEIGARVALVERERTGGDCLYTGCVPSKALLAAAERAHAVRTAGRFGISAPEPEVDFAAVMAHVNGAIEAIEGEDSPEALRARGIEVIEAEASFTGPGRLDAGGRELRFRTAIVATGSRPSLPPIAGLADCDPLTNESVFELTEQPRRLVVLGGGPIGCELGQAFARLGSEVSVVEATDRLLGREEPEASALLAESLADDGVELRLGSPAEAVEPAQGGAGELVLYGGERVGFDRILVATGRDPVTDGLGLDAAGVAREPNGAIRTDERLRTSGDRIFAAGDVAGELQFTHVAAYHGVVAIANGLFRARQRAERDWIPWATFTDPEVAHAGLTEAEARERHGDRIEVYIHDYADNDRAVAAGATRGFAKLIARRGKLIGATIVGPAAGESIAEPARLIREGRKVADLSQMVHVYPTFTEGPARAADLYWERHYFTPTVRRFTRPLLVLARLIDHPR